ncbi:YrdB family protein [Microtetraspora malaysiensis]|uniref:YrdB family protein n=1 Tax=Microtetraspora malaysiensis TaxID=161358 RepID=UPI0008357ED0|nr:YrdB family protein [Microtetraspora malaysiensis]
MLAVAKGVNLALMFFLELGVLVSVGSWGFTLSAPLAVRILAGLGAPMVFGTLWGLFAAANGARFKLHGLARAAFEIAWFGGGAAALVASGLVTSGVVFAGLYIVNGILRLVWHQV